VANLLFEVAPGIGQKQKAVAKPGHGCSQVKVWCSGAAGSVVNRLGCFYYIPLFREMQEG
jgi:hypothetical protein